MTAFDAAWSVAKAPLWTESGTTADYEAERSDGPADFMRRKNLGIPEDYANARYNLIPTIPPVSPHFGLIHPDSRYWESKNKDARGFATFREGDAPDDPTEPYHQLSLFEMARDAMGKGLMRDRFQEMIAELREHDPEARSTHVTHSERKTAALWDKMVDEGLLDSASTKPYVTTTPEGRLIPKTG